jgi:DNA-binding MarR family transcriptional regulator
MNAPENASRGSVRQRLEQTTPFPNHLIDTIMPALSDTQWRLVCLLVRQTLGWKDSNGQRKEWEWLSHSQLRKRTGRASAALSRAIDGLVKQGLVEVATAQGVRLSSPAARRQSQERLFFRLSDQALALPETSSKAKFQT